MTSLERVKFLSEQGIPTVNFNLQENWVQHIKYNAKVPRHTKVEFYTPRSKTILHFMNRSGPTNIEQKPLYEQPIDVNLLETKYGGDIYNYGIEYVYAGNGKYLAEGLRINEKK